jgi:DNA-dependent RNA polymerase auxiliary subunit epsilon
MAARDLSKLFEETLFLYFEKELAKVQRKDVTPEKLKTELVNLESKILSFEQESEFFDSKKPLMLIAWSHQLLERVNEFDEKVRVDVLAAISYFINSDDMISDLDIFEGYDDDYIVMKNIIEHHNIDLKK